jgi:hypothetical protein
MSNCPSCGKPNCGNWSACARRRVAADEKADKIAAAWSAVVKTEVCVRQVIADSGHTVEEVNALPPDKLGNFRKAVAAEMIAEVQKRDRLKAFGLMFFGLRP